MKHEFHKSGFCIYCGTLRRRDAYSRRVIAYEHGKNMSAAVTPCTGVWPDNWYPLVRSKLWVIGGIQLTLDLRSRST